MKDKYWLIIILGFGLVLACDRPQEKASEPIITAKPEIAPQTKPASKKALFGDLHVHTGFSFDAFVFATRAMPDDAYRYARGGILQHPAGFDIQLDRPLDFYAVTDHAMFLGVIPAMEDPESSVSKHPIAAKFNAAETPAERRDAFTSIRPFLNPKKSSELNDMDIVRSAWQEIIASAERNNEPGKFTTFIAYEYTSSIDQQNLHRNVIFAGSEAPAEPFSRLISQNPEELWDWMDGLREQGMEALAIPHNSNGSNGQMFALVDWAGELIDDKYALQRIRNEPLVEITQVKGTSDTHPSLSPNDEWADFEITPYRVASDLLSEPEGSYVRQALQNGLVIESQTGVNPYQFGLIGSSDTHNAASSLDESNYFSKVGVLDATAKQRGSVPLNDQGDYMPGYFQYWGASGLAGVWAQENTRKSIYAALRRKETFATSGPRIQVRLFASFDYSQNLLAEKDVASAAEINGVAMGSTLSAHGNASPRFFVWATQDALGGRLQRAQIIKGWAEDGELKEKVYDVACSDGTVPDKTTHRCPDNGANVDLNTCKPSPGSGAAELKTLWTDPEFQVGQKAFYYLRVLENPSCRWSTWDALRAGVAPRPDLKATIQERAWSSPIWIEPEI